MSTVLRERVRPGVDLVTLNRPDRLNTLSYELIDDLYAQLGAADADETCRVVVLTGAGRAFCAGLDLQEMNSPPPGGTLATPQGKMLRQERIAGLIPYLRSVRKPIISAVNGAAAGGGFALALGSDIRIASASARFNAAFIKIGVSACELGLSWLLPRLVGASRAFELMLSGRFIDAGEADRIGLLAGLTADGEVVDRALDMADAICANSPFGVWMTKEVMWSSLETPGLSASMDLENRTQLLGLYTQDHNEAVAAFFDKRSAAFTNT